MKTKENLDSRRRFATVCLLLAAVCFLYHGLALQTFSHWWFEDDAWLLAFVRDTGSPLRPFWDRRVLLNGPVPMQSFSFWIDNTVAYQSILFAHLHQVVSLTITVVLLFYVLRGFGLNDRDALILDLLWLCLPAVVAVNEFISARHYLEGFACSLGAVLVAQKIGQGRWRESFSTIALLVVMLATGALFKELYAITAPLFVCCYLYACRRYLAGAAALLMIPLYGFYRIWAVGAGFTWHMPLADAPAYFEFLGRIPYIFTGNTGGYVVLVALALLCLWRFRNINLRIACCALLLLCSALATIYPTTFAISRDWLVHGTWYRVMFLVNTIILLGGGYWLCKTQTNFTRVTVLILIAVSLLHGAFVTARHWHEEMVRYEREGRYYLKHKDRLIYSELAASWYLDGLQKLYQIVPPHHVTSRDVGPLAPQLAANYQTIWRYRDGTFVEDRQLYERLRDQR